MNTQTTGLDLERERIRAGVSMTALGRAMGYGGGSPHARVYQIEAQRVVSPLLVTKYRAALATLTGANDVVA